MDFHWYFSEISTGFPIDLHWYFIEISHGISLKLMTIIMILMINDTPVLNNFKLIMMIDRPVLNNFVMGMIIMMKQDSKSTT